MTSQESVEFAPAETSVDVSFGLTIYLPVPLVPPPVLLERYVGFDLQDYIVDAGVAIDLPSLAVFVETDVGLGAFSYDDQVPDPISIDTKADVRWLALADNYVAGSDWLPYAGDASIRWQTSLETSPYLDPDYSYDRFGQLVYRPAMVFDSGSWFKLSPVGWSITEVTIAMVAVLHGGFGGYYGIMESQVDVPAATSDGVDDDPANQQPLPADIGLRYRHGVIEVWAGSKVVEHRTSSTQARPVILVLTLSPTGGKLMVLDTTRSSRTFSTNNISSFDLNIFLGRTGASADQETNAVMDVLEMNYFSRSLDFAEIEELVTSLDACYGVST